MSYDRMQKDAVRLRQKVQELLAAAEAADAQEDAEFGEAAEATSCPRTFGTRNLVWLESSSSRRNSKPKLVSKTRRQPSTRTIRRPARQRRRLPKHQIPRTKDGSIDPKASAISLTRKSRNHEGLRRICAGITNCQERQSTRNTQIINCARP